MKINFKNYLLFLKVSSTLKENSKLCHLNRLFPTALQQTSQFSRCWVIDIKGNHLPGLIIAEIN